MGLEHWQSQRDGSGYGARSVSDQKLRNGRFHRRPVAHAPGTVPILGLLD
jgi:hypothetical protein